MVVDYGQLDKSQELDYIQGNINLRKDKHMSKDDIPNIVKIIHKAHNFVWKHFSKGSVSQRDLDRVFKLFDWFRRNQMYQRNLKKYGIWKNVTLSSVSFTIECNL